MTSDPVRLLEDPSATSALRSDLVHAVEVEVHGLDLAAGLASLQKATASVTSSTTVVAGTSLFTKLAIGAGVAAGAVVLWLGLGGGDPPAGDGERVAAPAVVSVAEPEADDPRGGLQRRVLGESADRVPAPVEAEPAQPEPAKAEAGEPAPAPALAKTEADEPEPTGREAGDPKPTSTARRKGATGDRPSPASSKADDDGVLREAKLVAKARRDLARDPAQALALAEEAERDFPRGQLVEERRAIAIRALIALGRRDEAQRRAEPFLAEYGRGAHAAAVRRALEDGGETP